MSNLDDLIDRNMAADMLVYRSDEFEERRKLGDPYTRDETVKAKECAEQIRNVIRTSLKPVAPDDPQASFAA